MSLGPRGKQPFMREIFIHQIGRPQLLVWPDTPTIPTHLRGKQKGIMQILKEQNLWPKNGRHSDGVNFLLQCPKDSNRTGCSLDLEGERCACSVLAAEQDFKEQKGRLQEELECRGQPVIFYPKFHCELNPIEPYWCKAKRHTREHCDYSLEGLRQTVPKALALVEQKTICGFFNRSMRIIEAY